MRQIGEMPKYDNVLHECLFTISCAAFTRYQETRDLRFFYVSCYLAAQLPEPIKSSDGGTL